MSATEEIEPAPTPLPELRALSRIALYAALVGAGAFIHIPVGPFHISLQPLMAALAGFALGPKHAALALLLYNACGFIGLPMYGRGRAGPASFLGPTAGYFAGFLVCAVVCGISTRFTKTRRQRIAAMLIFGSVGTALTLILGTLLLRWRFIPDWNQAIAIGFLPFIGGDLLKMLAAAGIKETFLTRNDAQ